MLKSVSFLFTGNFVAQAINLISLPIFSRLFSPDIFGDFGQLSAIIWIVVVVVTLQLEHLLVTLKTKVRIAILTQSLLYAVVVISIVLGIILFSLSALGFIEWEVGLIIFFSSLTIGLHQIVRMYSSVIGKFNILAIAPILNSAGMISATLSLNYFVFSQNNVYSLLCGQLIGFIFATIYLYFNCRLELRFKTSLSSKVKVFLYYIPKSKILLPVNLIKTLNNRLPILLLSYFGFKMEAGYLSMADKIVGAPCQILGNSISSVLKNKLSNMSKSKNQNLTSIYRYLIYLISFLTFGYGFTFQIIPDLTVLVLGKEWVEGVQVMRFWSLVLIANVVFLSFEDLLVFKNEIEKRLILQFLKLTALFSIGFVFYFIQMSFSELFVLIIIIKMLNIIFDVFLSFRNKYAV